MKRPKPTQALLIEQLQHNLAQLAFLGIDLPESDRVRSSFPLRNHELLVPCTVRDLSSTLLLVAVKGNRYVALHLGDGIIGYQYLNSRQQSVLATLSRPENGEYTNETIFVPSAGAQDAIRLYTGRLNSDRRQVIGFILMSDGSEACLYHKRTAQLAPACEKFLAACRALPREEMEDQLESTLINVISKKTSDDCSLALLAR